MPDNESWTCPKCGLNTGPPIAKDKCPRCGTPKPEEPGQPEPQPETEPEPQPVPGVRRRRATK